MVSQKLVLNKYEAPIMFACSVFSKTSTSILIFFFFQIFTRFDKNKWCAFEILPPNTNISLLNANIYEAKKSLKFIANSLNISEDEMIEAVVFAHENIKKICEIIFWSF